MCTVFVSTNIDQGVNIKAQTQMEIIGMIFQSKLLCSTDYVALHIKMQTFKKYFCINNIYQTEKSILQRIILTNLKRFEAEQSLSGS